MSTIPDSLFPYDVPYRFAPDEDILITKARTLATTHGWQAIALVVKNGEILALGSGDNPDPNLVRDDPQNHGARQAIFEAERLGYDLVGGDVVLWGVYRLCKECGRSFRTADLRSVSVPKACAYIGRDHSRRPAD